MVASAHGTELRDDVADGQVGRWDRYDSQAHRDGDRDGAHLFPAGLEPRLLALSSDNSRLFYTQGALGNVGLSGLSVTSETVRSLDLVSQTSSADYAAQPPGQNSSYSIIAIAPVPDESNSVVVLNDLAEGVQDGPGVARVDLGPQSVRVYDDGVQRRDMVTGNPLDCLWLAAGSTSNSAWCLSSVDVTPLTLDPTGVQTGNKLYINNLTGPSPQFVFSQGRMYTAEGNVIDTVAMKPVGSVAAKGNVAVDSKVAWWLDAGDGATPPTVTLRWFDAETLHQLGTKQINVLPDGPLDVNISPVLCGTGRVAFRLGRQIYIVQIPASELPKSKALLTKMP